MGSSCWYLSTCCLSLRSFTSSLLSLPDCLELAVAAPRRRGPLPSPCRKKKSMRGSCLRCNCCGRFCSRFLDRSGTMGRFSSRCSSSCYGGCRCHLGGEYRTWCSSSSSSSSGLRTNGLQACLLSQYLLDLGHSGAAAPFVVLLLVASCAGAGLGISRWDWLGGCWCGAMLHLGLRGILHGTVEIMTVIMIETTIKITMMAQLRLQTSSPLRSHV